MAVNSSIFSKKTSVKGLLDSATGGLTFRKTFTPQPVAHQYPSTVKVTTPSQVNDKKIFNRLCDLFDKDAEDMNQVLAADPAKAAADVLGYSYQNPSTPLQMQNKVEEEEHQVEIKNQLMKEIKEKISERRRKILQQRRDLFEPNAALSIQDAVELRGITSEMDMTDVWKAVPALADPDADNSFEEDRERWDPDAAFSEVERILESLESNAALNEELVNRFRMDHRQGSIEDEDKRSEDSGMSSSGDMSNSSTSAGSNRQEVLVAKPVRKSKQQVAIVNVHNQVGKDDLENQINRHRHQPDLHIYSVAHDSPVIIDSDHPVQERTRIRLELTAPTPTSSVVGDDQEDGRTDEGRRRTGTLTNSAGEIFGSLRSNLSAGAYSTGEALNRIAQHVSENIVRPIAETMGEAGDGLVRAAEPLVQHLQLLSTRLQVRYMHAAQHKNWLPHFALMREASDWIEGIPKVNIIFFPSQLRAIKEVKCLTALFATSISSYCIAKVGIGILLVWFSHSNRLSSVADRDP